MVNPVTIEIFAPQVGLNKIDIPAFAGYEIMVGRRGVGFLTSDEVRNLPTGGFELKLVGDVFLLGEVYSIIPIPKVIAPPISIPVYAVNQYPHRMVITSNQGTTQDSEGNWVIDSDTTTEIFVRAEPSTGNSFFSSADGKQVIFNYLIYMPLPAPAILPGNQVSIYNQENELIGFGEIKRFAKGQLNARAWL